MNPFRPGIALILVLSLAAAAGAQTADINCTVNQSSQCPSPSVQFLRLSGQTDSHASLSAYDYRVCCSLSSGGRLAGSITANATNSCADLDTEFASLSASTRTNSHIGKDYSAKICMSANPGSAICQYQQTNCSYPRSCAFTQTVYGSTHVASCLPGGYLGKTCCRYFDIECGNLNQTCCAGECNPGLACNLTSDGLASECVSMPQGCGNFICEQSENCDSCPGDCGCDGKPAKLRGRVLNLTGSTVQGARVTVLGTGITAVTDSLGKYTLSLDVSANSPPYLISAEASGYESSARNVSRRLRSGVRYPVPDLVLLRPLRGCNNDCTKADGRCYSECQNRGACLFSSQRIADACNGYSPGLIADPDNADRQILCCSGSSFEPSRSNVNFCDGLKNIKIVRKSVFFKGKIIQMVLLVFDSSDCRQ